MAECRVGKTKLSAKHKAGLSLLLIVTFCFAGGAVRAADLDSAWQFSDRFLHYMWESDNQAYPDSVIRAWLNDGFSAMEKYAVVQSETTIVMVPDQRKYDLPSDYVQGGIWAAHYYTEEIEEDWFWSGLRVLWPGNWVPPLKKKRLRELSGWGSTISIIPPPTDTDTIFVEYAAEVTRFYSDNSLTNLPQNYRPAAVYFACMQAAAAAKEPDKLQHFGALWNQEMAFIQGQAAELKARREE